MSGKKNFSHFSQADKPKEVPGRRVVGEGGSNDLPPLINTVLLKGGGYIIIRRCCIL